VLTVAYTTLSQYAQSRRAYALCVLVLTVAYTLKRRHSRWFRMAECRLSQMAQWRRLWTTLIGLLALGGSATVALSTHIRAPKIHDGFSYLLAADTFAHGRLSNPTHPMWVHFGSFHIIQQPTYASKYPPAQGLMLAVGQLIGRHPIVGVWLSAGLACAAMHWMLLALRFGIFIYWSQSYWGGAVVALGGALVFGGLRRIIHCPRLRDAILMSGGVAVLANSRPYEGLLGSLPAGIGLLAWMVGKHGPPARVSIRRIVLPTLLGRVCKLCSELYLSWDE
jgi:hypothetical protein